MSVEINVKMRFLKSEKALGFVALALALVIVTLALVLTVVALVTSLYER